MKSLLCFVSVLVVLSPSLGAPPNPLDIMWNEWKVETGKTYSSPKAEMERRKIWEENLDFILTHNNRVDVSYKLKMNTVGDLKFPAKGRQLLNVKKSRNVGNTIRGQAPPPPKSFDWRRKGVISPVKNQGQTGSVGAIVAEECVESYTAIRTGNLALLSVKEVADCCFNPPGLIDNDVFACIHNIGGLCSPTTYHSTGGQCGNKTCRPIAQVQGTKFVPTGREDIMQLDLLEVPLMVYVDASRPSFQFYTSGIYEDPACSKTQLDHALQLVGYGEIEGKIYWMCKNSWGKEWGMEGYILILRGKNMCGIAEAANYPY